MNKILFRGFHPDENGATTITLNGEKIKGEWVYGCYVYDKQNFCIRDFAYEYKSVIPETVGQWVRLDKNGKDVFNGDILKDVDGRIYEIKYFDFEWIAEQTKSFWINVKHLKACETIGNIWEVENERV